MVWLRSPTEFLTCFALNSRWIIRGVSRLQCVEIGPLCIIWRSFQWLKFANTCFPWNISLGYHLNLSYCFCPDGCSYGLFTILVVPSRLIKLNVFVLMRQVWIVIVYLVSQWKTIFWYSCPVDFVGRRSLRYRKCSNTVWFILRSTAVSPVVPQPKSDVGHLVFEVYRSNTDAHTQYDPIERRRDHFLHNTQ